MLGAGGIYASLEDLYHWDQALYGDAVVKQETLEEAFTPATLADERLSDYGFGWGLGTWQGHRMVAHSGGWVAFRTHIMRLPDVGFTVAVLTNGADGSPAAFATRIAALYVAEADAGETAGGQGGN
jgi:CubicO group peptidase (beta-lactamase class C family)